MKIRRAHLRAPFQLSRRRKWIVYGITAGLWSTGAIWLVLHYGMQRQGEFGASPHPLEAWSLEFHAAFAFATLWLAGFLWAIHIAPSWKSGNRRISGILTVALLAILVVTGYLLYYAGGESLRATVAIVHWVTGLAALVPFLIHLLHRRARGAERGRLAGQAWD